MRIKPRFSELADFVALELRAVERPGVVTSTFAPANWTDVRVEAWLDWVEGLPTDLPVGVSPLEEAPDAWLGGAAMRWAHRLGAWGLQQGLFAAAEDADTFASELSATLLLGVAAPGAANLEGASAPGVIALDDPGSAKRLADLTAARRGERLSARAAEALSDALRGVADAVDRCEGPPAACADPARNPALARAALTARRCGTSDADIIRAAEGQSFTIALPEQAHHPVRPVLAHRDAIASGSPEALTVAAAALEGDLALTSGGRRSGGSRRTRSADLGVRRGRRLRRRPGRPDAALGHRSRD